MKKCSENFPTELLRQIRSLFVESVVHFRSNWCSNFTKPKKIAILILRHSVSVAVRSGSIGPGWPVDRYWWYVRRSLMLMARLRKEHHHNFAETLLCCNKYGRYDSCARFSISPSFNWGGWCYSSWCSKWAKVDSELLSTAFASNSIFILFLAPVWLKTVLRALAAARSDGTKVDHSIALPAERSQA